MDDDHINGSHIRYVVSMGSFYKKKALNEIMRFEIMRFCINLKIMKNDDKFHFNNRPSSEDARHDTLRTTASTCASWRNPTGLFWNESFKVSKFQSFIKGFFI